MRVVLLPALTLACLAPVAADGAAQGQGQEKTSRISDESVSLIDPDDFPRRPRPLLELGNPFLGSGTLRPGFRLPGGAVWQPSLLAFGTYRVALQGFNDGGTTVSELSHRLDLFANLQLTGTERLLLGLRPLDEDGRFGGYNFNGDPEGRQEEFNADISTLFFEGDFGELFPNLDRKDHRSLDFGFAIGRQPLSYQEGMLIADSIDAIGVTRNTLLPRRGSDMQVTFIYGWNDLHRDDNIEDQDAQLTGVFLAADFPKSTFNADFVYILATDDDTDGLYWGLSGVRRIGHVNASLRLLGSHALDAETPAVSDGTLAFVEASWTPPWKHDLLYANAFWGIDNFSSAARDPAAGGPLGRAGILFAAVGLGRFGAALGNRADEAAGGAMGYQMFTDHTRRQVIFEIGGVHRTASGGDDQVAAGVRFQQAVGRRLVLQLDAHRSAGESRDPGWGARFETRLEF